MSAQSPIDDQTRFSPIGENDHAGYLWIVTTLGIIYTGLAAALRGHIKWGLLGSDDYCLGFATVRKLRAVPLVAHRPAYIFYFRWCIYVSR